MSSYNKINMLAGKHWFILVIATTGIINSTLLVIPSCSNQSKNSHAGENHPDKEQLMQRQSNIVDAENQEIDNYIQRHGYKMVVTGTGLRYQIVSNGTGNRTISTGDEVELKYRVSLLDGTMLYSSDSSGVLKFRVDKSDMASGMHEGVKFMKDGDKAVFIMPSHLAYGLTGDGGRISHYKVLVVETELLSSIKE